MPEIIQQAQGLLSVQLFDSAACQLMIRQIREAKDWSDATVGDEGNDGTVRSVVAPSFRHASVIFLEDLPLLSGKFDRAIDETVKSAVRQVWNLNLDNHQGAQVIRYRPGGHYCAHADAALDQEDRYVTVLCYLNDDFEGGQTTFPYLDNLSIQPESGKAVIFPSTYIHRAEPVLSGEKFAIVTWLIGPSPVRWI